MHIWLQGLSETSRKWRETRHPALNQTLQVGKKLHFTLETGERTCLKMTPESSEGGPVVVSIAYPATPHAKVAVTVSNETHLPTVRKEKATK